MQSTLYIIKSYGVIPANANHVFRALATFERRKQWDIVLNPEIASDKDFKSPTYYYRVLPSASIFARDFVIKHSYAKDFPHDGCYVIHGKSVEIKSHLANENFVRGKC